MVNELLGAKRKSLNPIKLYIYKEKPLHILEIYGFKIV